MRPHPPQSILLSLPLVMCGHSSHFRVVPISWKLVFAHCRLANSSVPLKQRYQKVLRLMLISNLTPALECGLYRFDLLKYICAAPLDSPIVIGSVAMLKACLQTCLAMA